MCTEKIFSRGMGRRTASVLGRSIRRKPRTVH
jgi:hypothetical protein